MEMIGVEELLLAELRDLYASEQRLTQALPKAIRATGIPALREALRRHLAGAQENVDQLERVLSLIGRSGGWLPMTRTVERGGHYPDERSNARSAAVKAAAISAS